MGRGVGPQPLFTQCGLSCTEEEKAEVRAFEEDQVAGRLKEDVVGAEGEEGSGKGLSLPHGPHVVSLWAA